MPNPYTLAPHMVSQQRPQIIYGNVSTNKPAPRSPSDPLYVVVPQWDTTVFFKMTEWPMCNGSALPQRGAIAILVVDSSRTMRCVYWHGAYSNGGAIANPMSFGAVGDSVVDDVTAVRAAGASLTNGGILDMSGAPKSFLMSGWVVLPDKAITVVGQFLKIAKSRSINLDVKCSPTFSDRAVFTHAAAVSTSNTVPVGQGITFLGLSMGMNNVPVGNGSGGILGLGNHIIAQDCCVWNTPGIACHFADTNVGTPGLTLTGTLNGTTAVTGIVAGTAAVPPNNIMFGVSGTNVPAGALLTMTGSTTGTLSIAATGSGAVTLTMTTGFNNSNSFLTDNIIHNNAFEGFGVSGIQCGDQLTGASTDGYVTDNIVTGWTRDDGDAIDNTGPGAYLTNAADWYFERNHIRHTGRDGAVLQGATDTRVKSNYINQFAQEAFTGTTYNGLSITQIWGSAVLCEGNEVRLKEGDPTTTTSGSYTAGAATMAVADASAFPIHGMLAVTGVTGLVTYTGVTGNTFTGCSGGAGTAADGAAVTVGIIASTPIYQYFNFSVNSASGPDMLMRCRDNVVFQDGSGTAVSTGFAVSGNTTGNTRTLNVLGDGNLLLGNNGAVGGGTTQLVKYAGTVQPTWVVSGMSPISTSGIGVTIGSTGGNYGPLATVLSPLFPGTFVRMRGVTIHWGGTFGSESPNLKLTYTWDDGTTSSSALATTGSTGAQTPVPTSLLPTNSMARCVLVQASAKSTIGSSAVTLTVDSVGDAAA